MSVLFDQLRISDDGKTMFIDCHVNKAHYFDNLYITKLTICTEDQVHETDPMEYTEYIYQQVFEVQDPPLRELHLLLGTSDLNKTDLSHNMFFVYVECAGTPDACTPCRLDEMITVGVTYDYGLVFNTAMNYTRELNSNCVIPDNFIDFIMNVEALKIALETEHYVPAISFWKNLMNNNSSINNTPQQCGCHG